MYILKWLHILKLSRLQYTYPLENKRLKGNVAGV